MRYGLSALALIACLTLFGCGGESDGGSAGGTPGVETPGDAGGSVVGTYAVDEARLERALLQAIENEEGLSAEERQSKITRAKAFAHDSNLVLHVKADGTWTLQGESDYDPLDFAGDWKLDGETLTIHWTKAWGEAVDGTDTGRFAGGEIYWPPAYEIEFGMYFVRR